MLQAMNSINLVNDRCQLKFLYSSGLCPASGMVQMSSVHSCLYKFLFPPTTLMSGSCVTPYYTAWKSTLSISSNLLGYFKCLGGDHKQHFASSWVSSLNLNWISWSNNDKYWDFRAQLQVAMSNTVLEITDLQHIFALHISFSWYGDVHTLGLTQLQPYFTDSLMHFHWGRTEFEATLI